MDSFMTLAKYAYIFKTLILKYAKKKIVKIKILPLNYCFITHCVQMQSNARTLQRSQSYSDTILGNR